MGRSNRIRPRRLGEKLLKIRKDLDLTQTELITRLDYSETVLHPQGISDFENSKSEPNLFVLLAYARLAGVYVDFLIDDKLDL